MTTQTLDTHVVLQSKHLPMRQGRSKRGKTAITLALSGALVLGMGVMAWGMLRAQFNETFREFPACGVAAADRAALNLPGATSPNA